MVGLVWEYGGPESDAALVPTGHEADLIQWAKEVVASQGEAVFLDVGAHAGAYSLNLAKHCKEVYAVEANPVTFDLLQRNIEANKDALAARVLPYNYAAWDSTTWLVLHDPSGRSGGGTMQTRETGEGHKVRAHRLDEMLTYDVFPTFVKIDVEGAEAHVLRGMTGIIERSRPVLFVEMHDQYLGRPEIRTQVIDFMQHYQYEWDDSTTYLTSYYIKAWPL